jgi:hypothetical protein
MPKVTFVSHREVTPDKAVEDIQIQIEAQEHEMPTIFVGLSALKFGGDLISDEKGGEKRFIGGSVDLDSLPKLEFKK